MTPDPPFALPGIMPHQPSREIEDSLTSVRFRRGHARNIRCQIQTASGDAATPAAAAYYFVFTRGNCILDRIEAAVVTGSVEAAIPAVFTLNLPWADGLWYLFEKLDPEEAVVDSEGEGVEDEQGQPVVGEVAGCLDCGPSGLYDERGEPLMGLGLSEGSWRIVASGTFLIEAARGQLQG